MRIGILCKDFLLLKNWELRIIDELINNPSYSISLLINDTRLAGGRGQSTNFLWKNKKLVRILFHLQEFIEKRIYPQEISVNTFEIFSYLKKVDSINLYPVRQENTDIFSVQDIDRIKTYNLDLLIKLGFNNLSDEILNSARYGTWSIVHSDCSIVNGYPVGFWEIVQNQPVIGATLVRLTQHPDGGQIIDKGFYNRHWSFIQSNNIVTENSVNLLLKNLNLLKTQNHVQIKKAEVCPNQKQEIPNLKLFLKYIFSFYGKSVTKVRNRMLIKLGIRPEGWAIFSSYGNILKTDLSKSEILKPEKKHFWADPFTFNYNDINYVFFENYSYSKAKGVITCGILKNNKISSIKDVLVRDYHLSYPFMVQINKDIFMIPETGQNKRLEVYKSTEFPLKWDLYSTGFDGVTLVDTTLYTDSNNDLWIFTNIGSAPLYDCGSELYIFKIDSLKLNKIIPHKKNPVIIDCKYGRNAGPIFKDGDKVIRPSQYIINEVYGYGINLSIIKKLTIDEYEEELITTIRPDFKEGLIATHHLCQTNDGFVIDGSYEYL